MERTPESARFTKDRGPKVMRFGIKQEMYTGWCSTKGRGEAQEHSTGNLETSLGKQRNKASLRHEEVGSKRK